ncbi:MAG TPA: methyltransferase domain-containing protein [Dehalococcoidia bacterium]|nr:methyltransferase domain-containing protein [Dehalococcoidia bacterium]
MSKDSGPTPGERILAVLDALGVSQAHFLTRSPLDVLGVVDAAPNRIASIGIQGSAARPEEFGALAAQTLWLIGDSGEAARAMVSRTGANIATIKGYTDFMWSDTVAERTQEVWAAVAGHLDRMEQRTSLRPGSLSGQGETAGLTYRAAGSGTPVVLLPLGLSAHQWDALLPHLQTRHSTILLGGRYLQPVENLEARADGDYSRMALGVLDLAEPGTADAVVEVGCGSGALLRRIARRTNSRRIAGLDVNSFLLGEARALASSEGLAGRLEFRQGSAEAIPFADDTFDVAFSSTVMEEVDAERMLAEMVRITRPGGRVAVIVRGVDRGQWTNLALPKGLKRKVEAYSGSKSPHGCADETLVQRFHAAGLKNVRGGPAWSWVTPADAWWKNVGTQMLASLTAAENRTWDQALAKAAAAGQPIWVARPFHCAVGVK